MEAEEGEDLGIIISLSQSCGCSWGGRGEDKGELERRGGEGRRGKGEGKRGELPKYTQVNKTANFTAAYSFMSSCTSYNIIECQSSLPI